jgi:hypothetical protein
MRLAGLLFLATASIVVAAVACSSSSSSGGGSGLPSCQGAAGTTGAGSATCNSCVTSSCGSQVSSVKSACGAYLSCYQGCQCTDNTCLQGCLGKIDGTCQNAFGPLMTCLDQSCRTECGNTSPPDGGGPVD